MAFWSKRAIFVIIVAIAVLFSLYKLKESPSVWYDEGMYIQAAANMADGHGATFQFAPGYLVSIPTLTVGYPVIYPLAFLFKVFGDDILVARGMMVFFLLLFILAVFFLVKKKFGLTIALCSLALVATFPPLYGNGKTVLGEVPALLFMVLSLISLQQALGDVSRKKMRAWLIMSGFLAGVCASAKLLFLLFLPAFALAVFLAWRKKQLSFAHVTLAGVSALLPVIIWIFVQYYGTGSLTMLTQFYANPSGVRDLLGIVGSNIKNFFTAAGPLYLLLMMVTWTVSIFLRKMRKEDIQAPELAAFVFCVLSTLSYLRVVGWFRYLFPAQMIAMIYFVPSLDLCVTRLFGKVRLKLPVYVERSQRYLVFILVAVLSLWGIYGLTFDSWVADAYDVEKTAFWQDHFRAAPAARTFLFYEVPEVVIFAQNRDYYQYMALPTAGGPFGAEWLQEAADGGVSEIIIRTDTLGFEGGRFLDNYYPALRAYKYTILEKKK